MWSAVAERSGDTLLTAQVAETKSGVALRFPPHSIWPTPHPPPDLEDSV